MATSLVMDPVSAGSSLVGSVLGFIGQNKANKQNIALQRETNQLNADLTRETNAQNYQMFKEMQQYNDPSTQRAMLEAAGYNPADLSGSSYYNTVSSSGNAASVGNPMVSPHVEPTIGYQNAFSELAANIKLIADAKKASNEADNLKLQNSVYMKRFEAEFKKLGLENEWQEVQNRFANDAYDFNLDNLIKDLDLKDEQIQQLRLTNSLIQQFGEQEYDAKIENLRAVAYKAREEGKTQLSVRDLNAALKNKAYSEAHLADVNAWYQTSIFPYAAANMQSQTGLNLEQAVRERLQNELKVKFGSWEAAGQVLSLWSQGSLNNARIDEVYKHIQQMGVDMDKTEFDKVISGIETFFGSVKDIMKITNSLP